MRFWSPGWGFISFLYNSDEEWYFDTFFITQYIHRRLSKKKIHTQERETKKKKEDEEISIIKLPSYMYSLRPKI
jgi:hypothetical protein